MSSWNWAWYKGEQIEVESPDLEKAYREIRELQTEIDRLQYELAQERQRRFDHD